MVKNYAVLLLVVFTILTQSACSSDENYVPNNQTQQESPAVFNPEATPFNTLSEFHFFDGNLKDLTPTIGVLPYEPINSLFTDYAHKKRFVWMPKNTSADYANDYSLLNFPIGTVLIKNFYYENVLPNNTTKIIETRLIYNTSTGWEFANYTWNEDQTEAYFDLTGSYTNIDFIDNGQTKSTTYRIPSTAECFTCHKSGVNAIPIGLKPQNLNKSISYSDGIKNQFQKWIEMGYLEDNLPININTVSNWEDQNNSLSNRMRGYLDINCAHCHSQDRHCDYRPIRFAFGDYQDDVSLGVCVDPDTPIAPYSKIVEPGNIARSIIHFRLNTTQEEYRMPLLGRTLIHEEGVALLEQWIASLTTVCD
ncbi:hypothetical protein [Olleya sp. Bg11-27]|uniref:hypothetical protein n=1 Tax=Olleya sp. Bg11-27 TaxID=2058135 RepID=UPI000C31AD24|nr:hypothetical protein [Olleya sp. Bg11-27]AUC74602.1 hypothetical protein CW732_02465 [Olleya sp. Bg11-27]